MLICGVTTTAGSSADMICNDWVRQEIVSASSEKWEPMSQNPWYYDEVTNRVVIHIEPHRYHMDETEQSIFQEALFASAKLID